MGEGEKDIEGQSPHGRGGVELLGDGDERDALPVEYVHDLGKIHQRTGQAVDFIDDHDVDIPGGDIGEKLLQSRALHRPARIGAIVIGGGNAFHPSCFWLAI